MNIEIRKAEKKDCKRLMELIHQLAVYEKAPDEVTVTLEHFEGRRGKGVGKLLFDKLLEEAKAKEFTGMVWQVLDWNEPAINFYKKYEGVNIDGAWLNYSIN